MNSLIIFLVAEPIEKTNIWNVSFDDTLDNEYFLQLYLNESYTINVTTKLRFVYLHQFYKCFASLTKAIDLIKETTLI